MPITTRALQKTAADQPFRIAEIERRDPRPNDVVIAIKAAGICHSDIHTIRDEWGEAPFPLTVGHEIAGVVEAVGDAVTRHAVGTGSVSAAWWTRAANARTAKKVKNSIA